MECIGRILQYLLTGNTGRPWRLQSDDGVYGRFLKVRNEPPLARINVVLEDRAAPRIHLPFLPAQTAGRSRLGNSLPFELRGRTRDPRREVAELRSDSLREVREIRIDAALRDPAANGRAETTWP
jgi:hypothetical protein